MRVLFDLLLRFGLEAFKVDPSPEPEDADDFDETNEDEELDNADVSDSDNGSGDNVDSTVDPSKKTVKRVLAILTALLDSEVGTERTTNPHSLKKSSKNLDCLTRCS